MAFLKLSIVFVLIVSIAAFNLLDVGARSFSDKKRDPCCDSYPDRNIVGQDLVVTAGQPGDCCGICLGVSGCFAYVWDNYQGGTCYLKNASGPVGLQVGAIVGVPCEGLKKAGKQ